MLTLYLDVCCLNRPFDDQTQVRIRLESEAVLIIIARCLTRQWSWVGSEVLDLEISLTPDAERRRRVQSLAASAEHIVSVGREESERAQYLESLGFSAFDALHIACAETANADVLLTTDDRLLSKAVSHRLDLRVHVANPLSWLREVTAA